MSLSPTAGGNDPKGRRSALKKMGKAGAFILPAITTFRLTELNVRASGYQTTSINSAWQNYWKNNNNFLTQAENFWGNQKDRWYNIWSFMNKKGWI